jgi:hypothetical protein
MSLLVTAALLAAGGALAAGLTARALSRVRARRLGALDARASRGDERLVRAGFMVRVGDVISVGAREAWFEHGWLLSEGGAPVALLLFARDATLVALPAPRKSVFWSSECTIDLPSDAPLSLDVGGVRYERALRLPVDLELVGGGQDPPWTGAVLAEYRALGGEMLFTLGRPGSTRAWTGTRVDPAELETWGKAS